MQKDIGISDQYLHCYNTFTVTLQSKQTHYNFICNSAIMAEAAVTVLLENMTSLVQKEVGSLMGFDEELNKLSSTFTTIRAVLADAEMKQFEDMAIKNWLQKVEDAAFLLDDILDECSTNDLLQEYQKQKHGWLNKVHSFSCHSSFGLKNALFRRRMAEKMKKVRETLESIAEERKRFHLCETFTPAEKKAVLMDWRQTSSVLTEPEVYGREDDKERIVQGLIETSGDVEHVSVYPIVGLGGLGKTTLAQLVFNDDRITQHFELKIWVCVSEDFTLKRMIKAILESASGHATEDMELDPLQKQLQKTLQGKRYLLVLDDVWSEDQEKWDRLKHSLKACGSKGVSILVTTRLTKVASIMGTFPPHDLSFLSDDDCWSLFKQRAFGQDEEESEELATIGKEIVKKCKGLPLAAKALGGLLRFKREEQEWLFVKDSEMWNLPQEENSILPVLRLSYLNLPLRSRQCFSFCAIFPKDYVIKKDKLIHLWMANGFISSRGNLMVEDIAEEIINELCWASFFQDIEVDEFGNVERFKIHDLIHDLAQFVMGDACRIVKDERPIEVQKRPRHIMFVSPFTWNQFGTSCQSKSLRTVALCYASPSENLRSFESLRALDMCSSHMNLGHVFLSSLIHFKHLRSLNLASNRFTKLPEAISDLCNLQVLNVSYCRQLQQLPRRLKSLKALRHLCLRECTSLSHMPHEMGQLTHLRTLNIYIVGWKKGLWLAELGQLCLKGQVHIKNLERVRNAADAREANIMSKQLDELFLSWERNSQSELQQNVDQILEALQPHSKLVSLGVGGFRGIRFPSWVGNPIFKNLWYIKLADCSGMIQLPQLGKLPCLKELEIHNMPDVKYVDDESYDGGAAKGFPYLEYLFLSYMPKLERLSKEEGGEDMFPCLSKLHVVACPKLAFPSLPSVRILEIKKGGYERNYIPIYEALLLPQHLVPAGSCNQVQLSSIRNLCCLEILHLKNDEELTSFPTGMLQNLACLRELHIDGHNKLEVLPTKQVNLVALEELYIARCHSLESLTEQELNGLGSLQRLRINGCDKFKGLSTSFQCLTSLKHLEITRCPQVAALSEDIQHIPMLQSITLFGLRNLECVPDCWGRARSLQSLHIVECPKLTSLPLSAGWFDNLKVLIIITCPDLQKQFKRETGQYWNWIKHVPNVFIS